MLPNPVPEIDVHVLHGKLQSPDAFILLDVREMNELALVRLHDPRLIILPLSVISREREAALPEPIKDRAAEIYVICHHGVRSADVTRWLRKQGWSNVHSVRGGIDAYAAQIDRSVGFY
jgi:rhodanese-related sulfurtransferase